MEFNIKKNRITVYGKPWSWVARFYSEDSYMTVCVKFRMYGETSFWKNNHKNLITGEYKKWTENQ